MKIQSIIRRATGSTVKLGDQIYRFTPDNGHVCEVTDEAHIERLLSIREGFLQAGEAEQGGEGNAVEVKRGGRKAKAKQVEQGSEGA